MSSGPKNWRASSFVESLHLVPCRHVVGYLLELFCILTKLGASDSAISMLCYFPAASCQWSAHPPEEWIKTLGSPPRIPGIHQEDALAGSTTSPREQVSLRKKNVDDVDGSGPLIETRLHFLVFQALCPHKLGAAIHV